MTTKITGDGGFLGISSMNGGQLAGFRNILINGAVTINQRGLTYNQAANNAYWADRWQKRTGNQMRQKVEEVNYIPNTVYTLSGNGVTTRQVTSPSSGVWNTPLVGRNANMIQLEIGDTASEFEYRNYGIEELMCYRYYQVGTGGQGLYNSGGGNVTYDSQYNFFVRMRTAPSITRTVSNSTNINSGTAIVKNISSGSCILQFQAAATGSCEVTSSLTLNSEI